MADIRPITPLKRAIFESGMTQRAVAEAAGISEGQLSRVANGLHTGDETKAAIAAALRRPVIDVFPVHSAEVRTLTDRSHANRVGDRDEAA